MEKVILHEWPGVANLRNQLEEARKRYNAIFQEFDALKLGVSIESKYFLNRLIDDADQVVYLIFRDRIPAKDPATGLEVDKDAKMKGLKLPSLTRLKELIKGLENKQTIDERLSFMDLSKGRLIINEDYFQNHCDQNYRTVTYDPAVVEAYQAFKELEKAINKLQDVVKFAEPDRHSNSPVLRLYDYDNLTTGHIKFSEMRFRNDYLSKIK